MPIWAAEEPGDALDPPFPARVAVGLRRLFDLAMTAAMAAPGGVHVLMLLSDAYGGFGGISQYNRDFIEALCTMDEVASVEALPRIAKQPIGPLPEKLSFNLAGIGGRVRFAAAALYRGLFGPRPDILVCGHINLLPLAFLLTRARGARLVLQIHGIDAWQPTGRAVVNRLTGHIDFVLSVSQVTIDRYLSWARPPRQGTGVLPNMVALERFGPAPKAADLVERYGIAGKRVLMTFGRMAAKERAKGFDPMLNAMPGIIQRDPNIVYMLCGAGDDMPRLQRKARELGVAGNTIFTGLVDEDRKADTFRLADAFVMPSRGEGFGIVLLEAMACGVPVMASRDDGGLEAIREGLLGVAVDPGDPASVHAGVFETLARPQGIPDGLDYFAFPSFRDRLRAVLFVRPANGRDNVLI